MNEIFVFVNGETKVNGQKVNIADYIVFLMKENRKIISIIPDRYRMNYGAVDLEQAIILTEN